MGNALNFQQKFQNINLHTETQNFQGVYLEYGDLVHIIWDFEPLEDGTLEDLDSKVETLMRGLGFEEDDIESFMITTGLKNFASYLVGSKKQIHETVTSAIDTTKNTIKTTTEPMKMAARAMKPDLSWMAPSVEALPDTPVYLAWDSTRDLFFGLVNGVVDVFPAESLPDLCRTNTTDFYDAVINLFVERVYALPEEDVDFVYELVKLIKMPYGESFSCYYSIESLYVAEKDPLADGELTEEEALRKSIILVHDVLTNVLFNLGYMYTDIVNFVTLEQDAINYW